ncbi:MAG: FGGY family carbohydrate kinase [Chloroflexi bacterium]|nr:FGGY family carbohydrate kinase [Chloroflexota bacterium]
MALTLGIDLGTSAVKAVLVDHSGEVLRSSQVSYPIRTPQLGWAEQRPASWWRALRRRCDYSVKLTLPTISCERSKRAVCASNIPLHTSSGRFSKESP